MNLQKLVCLGLLDLDLAGTQRVADVRLQSPGGTMSSCIILVHVTKSLSSKIQLFHLSEHGPAADVGHTRPPVPRPRVILRSPSFNKVETEHCTVGSKNQPSETAHWQQQHSRGQLTRNCQPPLRVSYPSYLPINKRISNDFVTRTPSS